MITFHTGIQALRNFKVKALNKKISALIPNIELISSEYIHFIESKNDLNTSTRSSLDKLLNYAPKANLLNSNFQITITPRIGTISPWSSKASEICKLCGLLDIKRLERGIIYHFTRSTNDKELKTILEFVMDKMTESYLENIEDSKLLFNELQPSNFDSIDILENGMRHIQQNKS